MEASSHRRAGGEPGPPDRPPAGGLAELGGELPVEPDAVAHEEHVGGRRTELRYQADRVEGRAAGQLALLDEDDVPAAGGGEVIGDATTDEPPPAHQRGPPPFPPAPRR